ncbi:MAG TPA: lytic transglycosylase domain-containing protein [Bacteroidales bacterium]|nr:lytic transglycosylase domain-containing protein [Bacteroidales bacterium]
MKKRRKTFRNVILAGLVIVTALALYVLYGRLFPLAHEEIIDTYAEEYGVDPYLVYAVIHTESRFREDAVSPAGASGLMQITDETAEFIAGRIGMTDFQPEMIFEPDTNIRMGVYYLSYLEEKFPRKETRLAAYNAGPNRVSGWLTDEAVASGDVLTNIPFEETRNYVERVILREKIYRVLYFYRN